METLLNVVERDAAELLSDDAKHAFQHASFVLNAVCDRKFFEEKLQSLRRKVHRMGITATPNRTLLDLEKQNDIEIARELCKDDSLSFITYWALSEKMATTLVELQV